jgi:3-hydroxyanthranilate 3,4-dioxygenase
MFLLPGNIPHSPQRFEDTIGIVIERKRPEGSLGMSSVAISAMRFAHLARSSNSPIYQDYMRWYCESCNEIVYESSFHCTNLGTQLKPVIEDYFASDEKRTCGKCGHVNPKL